MRNVGRIRPFVGLLLVVSTLIGAAAPVRAGACSGGPRVPTPQRPTSVAAPVPVAPAGCPSPGTGPTPDQITQPVPAALLPHPFLPHAGFGPSGWLSVLNSCPPADLVVTLSRLTC